MTDVNPTEAEENPLQEPPQAGAWPRVETKDLAPRTLEELNAWWRAANYLSVGQIYLLDNPLLREPLGRDHIKPRLLGHWGTTPGLNFIYAHLNRVIRERSLNTIYVTGPGHGGPGMVANEFRTDKAIADINAHLAAKEKDLLTV